ncbi:helix-turn-helix domain-containing protein [Tenacibaculum sp. 190524A02b]|uniref:helix-turn-helix domain-containing protein n=1 Tax=Tenacibaculum vairaonense TaxID=3137860 RepID=UPI0031FB3F9A
MKTVIDFKRTNHRLENNIESQENLENNKEIFASQCKTIYEALLKGERISQKTAVVKYNIGDLRRRIKDLKDIHKINILDEWVSSGNRRFKEYFVS